MGMVVGLGRRDGDRGSGALGALGSPVLLLFRLRDSLFDMNTFAHHLNQKRRRIVQIPRSVDHLRYYSALCTRVYRGPCEPTAAKSVGKHSNRPYYDHEMFVIGVWFPLAA